MATIKIALAGNPNCGKTTMFNSLTGANQYVGNWPGVTVEKKEGRMKGESDIIVTDLPGIYSLSPYTPEEVVSRDYLAGNDPAAVLNLVDSTNIERNLYLTTQILELGKPVVIALNMIDVLKKSGDKIDTEKLSEALGCKIIETSALKGVGVKEAARAAAEAARNSKTVMPKKCFSANVEQAISKMEALVPADIPVELKRWYAIKLIERDSVVLERLHLSAEDAAKAEEITKALESDYNDDSESLITNERYEYITKMLKGCLKKSGNKLTTSDKVDKIVTNRWLGIPIFLAVMWVIYYISVTTVGTWMTDWTNDSFVAGIQEIVSGWMENAGANEVLTDCLVNGLIGGVGTILGFVPQMAVLFLLLSIVEDIGYMVRIAFVMDRVFRHFGLSGKSFIPLLISSGCGVPGIMASKTIENENDRRLTIITTTWVPCGAKLPVIALMGAVMVQHVSGMNSAWLAPAMYATGVACVLVAAIMLKKTKPFHGEAAPFVMELPQYHIPQPKTVLIHTWERLKGFMIKAGTVLFLMCLVMWFLSSYGFGEEGFGLVDPAESMLAAIGNVLRWIFVPLGFGGEVGGWQAAASAISGFVAKEGIVSTMGVLANVAEESVEEADAVASAVATWFPTLPAAISYLVFNLLDSPCIAAISTMAQNLQSRKWFWFAVLFQNIFAYVIALCVYQYGMLITAGAFGVGTVFAILFTIAILVMLFRPDPYKKQERMMRGRAFAAA
ncbi:ferrous iron transport protein B [Treponema sp. Marseille-Q4523]|uniref:ferrous iron transport protein B n=1 Tax=Treponema sp. Marseille-Q4523 TaxID=2810610 RepID=UPI0019608CCE|nr:ferrous iron transport protein B [Treponema sp. Marseille-Q4523]MBM7023828.1 ferrous iron transport protein B [Treponema sp. Marseille-Q4523]